MRLLLVQASSYLPSLGGANKANRLLLEQLAARGHRCLAIGAAAAQAIDAASCLARLGAAGVEGAAALAGDSGVVGFQHAGVQVEAVLDPSRLRSYVAARLPAAAADRVLVSSEDPAQVLLRQAIDAAAAPVVYLAHTALHLPFGPDGFLASAAQTELLRRAAAIVTVSGYMRDYCRRWAGLDSTVLRFPVYGNGPFAAHQNFAHGAVTLINPCAVKGIAILVELARRCPDIAFAAVPTWGTTAADLAALAKLPNLEIWPPAADIGEILARCRCLLVPSLWGEAFGQVAVEAMLRGVPALVSDAGGLPEAGLGVAPVVPVQPIRRYEERFDEMRLPSAVVPAQDVGPWEAALRGLLADRERYLALSRQARQAAHAFVAGISAVPHERFLEGLAPQAPDGDAAAATAGNTAAATIATAAAAGTSGPAAGGRAAVEQRLAALSPERLELLARRLRRSAGAAGAAGAARAAEEAAATGTADTAAATGAAGATSAGAAASGAAPDGGNAAAADGRDDAIPRLPRTGSPVADRFPLSFAQRRLWFLERFEPQAALYSGHHPLLIEGALRVPALSAALAAIVARHEVLRTTYAETAGEPLQLVHPAPAPRLPCIDLAGLPAAARRPEADRLAAAASRRGFDLERGPVLRTALVRLAAERHLLVLAVHHIAADSWSASVILGELAALYCALAAGAAPRLRELPLQYADFAAWQRGARMERVFTAQLAYWRRQLAGAPGLSGPSGDRPRPARPSFRGGRALAVLPPALAARLHAAARRDGATLYMVLLACWFALLQRLSGEDDLVVGTPIAGRVRAELEPLAGCFLNTLVLRAAVPRRLAWTALLAQVRRTALGAFAHQDLPFEHLVEALAPERSLSHTPLFQVLFNLINVPPYTRQATGLRFAVQPVETGICRFDLELCCEEQAQGLLVELQWSADLFDAPTARRLQRHWAVLLGGVAAAPATPVGALPLLDEGELHQLLAETNDTWMPRAAAGIAERFAAQAKRRPEAPAVVHGTRTLSYAELAVQAGRLADRLRRLGAGPESLVGIALERSPDLVVALLAVVSAGAAWLPLDPAYPAERLAVMLADARPAVLLATGATLAGGLAAAGPLPPLLLLDAAAERQEAAAQAAAPRELAAQPGQPAQPGLPGAPGAPDAGPADLDPLAYLLFTSGSTGRPKGVEVTRRALVNFLDGIAAATGLPAGGRLLAVTSVSFDIAALELLLPLLHGGTVEVAGREQAADGAWLAARLAAAPAGGAPPVALMQATPATWRLLMAAGWAGDPRLVALCGGEGLPRDLAAWLAARVGALWNVYGPTETTIWSSACRIDAGDSGAVSIGRPIANTRFQLLDPELRPVAPGSPGQLLIGGGGLARGYRGRPDLTAERFVPDPRSGAVCEAGARLYLTGDLARWLGGGRGIEILGRLDHQVKVRGFRIELGEIEAALATHPQVAAAVVTARDDGQGGRVLAAYVVPAGAAAPPAAAALAAHLLRRLPEHMLPGAFVVLPALPLTPNGKVDRRALPAPAAPHAAASADGAWAAPATPLEELVADLWRELLGAARVGRQTRFFELGGHSLLAVRLLARMRERLGVQLTLRDLFAQPTVAALAAAAARALAGGPEAAPPPLRRLPRDGSRALPLSFAQERLWFLDRLEPASAAYNVPSAYRLEGELDRAALAAALAALAARHEVLRTAFAATPEGPAATIAAAHPVPLPVVDLGALPAPGAAAGGAADGGAAAAALLLAEGARPFDLAAGPLWRALLLAQAPRRHLLALTLHHTVTDGASQEILLRELAVLYTEAAAAAPPPRGAAADPSLPPLAVQYADFAAWQRERLDGAHLAHQLAYWRSRWAGMPQALELPADRSRRAAAAHRGRVVRFALAEADAGRLWQAGQDAAATPFMVLVATLAALLHRYTGEERIAIGSAVSQRTSGELEGLIGLLVNTLPLRIDLDGRSGLAALLERLRPDLVNDYAHHETPFEMLVSALQPTRSAADAQRSPLFQVMLLLDQGGAPLPRLPGIEMTAVPTWSGSAKFDLSVLAHIGPGGLQGWMELDAGRFDAATAERLADHLARLSAAAAAAPLAPLGELPLLAAAEEQELLVERNRTAAPLPGGGLYSLFQARAAAHPEAPAAGCEGVWWSYGELERRARNLAAALRGLGVGPEVLVGIAMDRSLDMLAAVLGVLAAGGAYVPLDPAYPAERLAYMIQDSRLAVLLTDEGRRDAWPAAAVPVLTAGDAASAALAHPHAPAAAPDPGNLAYAIYTSGSTGRPKGVEVRQAAVGNLLASLAGRIGFTAADRLLAVTTLSFDIAVLELLMPLVRGGSVQIAPAAAAADGRRLAGLLDAPEITVMQATPATWRLLFAAGWTGRAGLRVLCGGEALPADLAARLLDAAAGLWNVYGPTETTIYSTCLRVAPGGDAASIGTPLANTRAYVLSRALLPLPPGAPGELFLGGAGLARGYLRRPDLTAERFVPDPFAGRAHAEPGARLYRTGDLACWLPGGELAFLGRLDHQVKVRGFRIEAGEIEAALGAHPQVAAAVVAARDDGHGGLGLVAWVVPAAGAAAPGAAQLREHLRQSLPDYMLPGAFVALPALPLTPAGKVDRRALPPPAVPQAAADGGAGPTPATPATPIAEIVLGIFRQATGRDDLGADDCFFLAGGHSLLATRIMARIRQWLGVDLPVSALFDSPTAAGLAAKAAAALAGGAAPAGPPLVRQPRGGPLPLSSAQQRHWYLQQLDPASAAFNIAGAVRIEGALDAALLAGALAAVVRRHEMLRTTFATLGDSPVQVIADQPRVRLPRADLAALPADRRAGELRRLDAELAGIPFDLARGPLLRAVLVRQAAADHAVLLTLHHIAGDAWSLGILVREIGVVYQSLAGGPPHALPELRIQYADYAAWQQARLAGDLPAAELAHWRDRLAGAPERLLAPDLTPRPDLPIVPARLPVALPPALAAELDALARQAGVTRFMMLLAGFAALLALVAEQTDVVIGTNVANRGHLETEGLVGCLLNLLVLRTDLGGDPSFSELLGRVRATVLEAHAHQELPYERLVQELRPGRPASRTELFQVKVDLTPAVPRLELGGLRLSPLPGGRLVARYDLHLAVAETADGLAAEMIYDAGVFAAPTVERLAAAYPRLLAEAVRRPALRLSELAAWREQDEQGERRERRQAVREGNLDRLRRGRAARSGAASP